MNKEKLMKKNTKKKLQKECLSIWREIVILMYGNHCLWPHIKEHVGPIQVHHIFHQGLYKSLKYDPINGFPLCRGAHCFCSKQTEREFDLWFSKAYPDRWDYLLQNRNKIFKETIQSLTAVKWGLLITLEKYKKMGSRKYDPVI